MSDNAGSVQETPSPARLHHGSFRIPSKPTPGSNGRASKTRLAESDSDSPREASILKRFGVRFTALFLALAVNLMLLALFPLMMHKTDKPQGIRSSSFSLSEPSPMQMDSPSRAENAPSLESESPPAQFEPEPETDIVPSPPEIQPLVPEIPDTPDVNLDIEPAPELIMADIAAPPPAPKPTIKAVKSTKIIKKPTVPAVKPAVPAPPKTVSAPVNRSAQASSAITTGGPAAGKAAGNKTTAAASEGKTGYSMSEVDTAPLAKYQPQPRYPIRAKRRRLQGWAKIRFLVDRQGKVRHLTVTQSKPKGVFEETVLETVSDWLFEPGLINGRQVDTWVTTTIRFNLRN